MQVLCLDLGTTTGYAVGNEKELLFSGCMEFKPGRFDGAGMRFLKFKKWLDEVLSYQEIDAVYFEEVMSHKGGDAWRVYGGLLAHLTAKCEEAQVPYSGIPVGTIKKHMTGKGNANKKMMIMAANERGHDVIDDNEADAISVYYTVREVDGYVI